MSLGPRQKRIIKAVGDGYATAGMKDESNAIDRRERELLAILAAANEEPVFLHPNMARRYREEITNLVGAINDAKYRDDALDAIRRLVDKVVLTPDPESDGLLINLYGDLAGILKVATGKPEIREESELDLKQIEFVVGLRDVASASMQGKLVAGDRNRLALPPSTKRWQDKMVVCAVGIEPGSW
jgi:hypothetical protein